MFGGSSMDVSPMPPPNPYFFHGRPSSPTSRENKRSRDDDVTADDYMDRLADQVVKRSSNPFNNTSRRASSSPPYNTPHHSPEHEDFAAAHVSGGPSGGGGGCSSAMCLTPLAGFACAGASLAERVGIRWGQQQRLGSRSSQEDCVLCRVDERGFAHGYFGVFDGHGGALASEYAAHTLHEHVVQSAHFPSDVLSALQDAFLRTDAELLRRAAAPPRTKEDNCGSAAAVVVVSCDGVGVAHAGDCRAILVKRSSSLQAGGPSFVELTHDHSAERIKLPDGGYSDHFERPDEVIRVQRAGGRMDAGGYVNVGDHSLPMTRAFGNLPLKVADGRDWQTVCANEQVVTALPDVSVHRRQPDDLCIIVASDGLFGGVMTSEQVANVARQQLEGPHANAADVEKRTARALADCAIHEHQSSDNVSVVVIGMGPPAPPYDGSSGVSPLLSLDNGALLQQQQQQTQQQHPLQQLQQEEMPSSSPPDLETSFCGAPVVCGMPSTSSQPFGQQENEHGNSRPRPTPLTYQASQESVTTADPCSPGRYALHAKLRLPFCEAYAPSSAEQACHAYSNDFESAFNCPLPLDGYLDQDESCEL